MKVDFWLTISRGGAVNARKTKPHMDPDSISIQMDVTIPDPYFQRPTFKASIIADDIPPPHFDLPVEDVVQALETSLGKPVVVQVIPEICEGGE